MDIEALAKEINDSLRIEVRDPFEEPWGDPEKTTTTQQKVWDLLHNHGITRFGVIGGKGAGKSHLSAAFAMHWGQNFPNSHGLILANSDRQAKDSAGKHLVKMASNMGYKAEYFGSKKVNGQSYSQFYRVTLGKEDDDPYFLVFVRSLESATLLEGSEFDWAWVEEIQDAEKRDFVKALSRVRGTECVASKDEKRPLMIVGMTEGEDHWMYDMVEERLELTPSARFDPEVDSGVLFEPSLLENEKNVGKGPIDELRATSDPIQIRRLVMGERVSSKHNLVLYEYRPYLHKTGLKSKLLTSYDPYKPMYISIDFNVSPMSASAWQPKPWNHEWDSDRLFVELHNGTVKKVYEFEERAAELDKDKAIATYNSLSEYREADVEVLAQVDEWEVWPDDPKGGGTRGLMRHICDDYAGAGAEIILLGDSAGNQRDPGRGMTNWDIVEDVAVERLQNPTVIPGVVSNHNVRTGEIKYDNPPVQDTINATNACLKNADGEVHLCFLPDSEYDSGGVAASVGNTKSRPNGGVDKKADRSDDREVARSHFIDTVRYVVWEWTDRGSMVRRMNKQEHYGESEAMNKQEAPTDAFLNFGSEEEGEISEGFGNRWML